MNIFFMNNWRLDKSFIPKLLSLRFWFGVFKKDYLENTFDDYKSRVVIISFCGFSIGAYQRIYD